MSKLLVNKVVRDFMKSASGFDSTDEATIRTFLHDAIEKGTLVIHEPTNAYTFGGVTVDLTDTQFATVLANVSRKRKIVAIKEVRNASTSQPFGSNVIGLKEAKDFVDHLSVIVDLSESVDVPYGY